MSTIAGLSSLINSSLVYYISVVRNLLSFKVVEMSIHLKV